MLLIKKKEELNDQHVVYKERESPRWGAPQYTLKAGISIEGYEGEGQIGNVSVTGCSLHSVTFVNIIPDTVYDVKFTPDKQDNLKPFNLKLRLNWTKSSENLFLAGFAIENGEDTTQLIRYIEVQRSRGLLPDYGNMRPGGK